MSHSTRFANRQRSLKRRYLLLALLGCTSLASGCGIPGLRRAQPGPVTPAAYSLNNGQPFWQSDVFRPFEPESAPPSSQTKKPESDDVEVDEAGEQASANPFARLIRTVSFNRVSQQDRSKKDQIEQDIREIERDLNDGLGGADDEDALQKLLEGNQDIAAEGRPFIQPAEEFIVGSDELIDSEIGISATESSAYLPHAAFYTDPNLLSLIQETLTGNQELRILSEEIRIAANETYARSGEYRPFVTLGAGAGLEKPGEHTRAGAVERQLEVADGRGFPEPLGDFLVAANLSWEIDIWKRLRNAQRSAAMRYLGTQEGRNYVVTRMVAEVAENYYELLALDSQLQTLETTIQIQQDSLKVALAKKKAGRGTELAVQRFRAEVEKNRSERNVIRQQIVEAENRINFLAGRYPQTVDRFSAGFVDLNMGVLGTGVPSELLQNRADIRKAEREVAAAGLDVQVARARFYPNLSLTGGLGWNAFSTGFLFRTPESLIYGVAGELVGPLINKRAIKAAYCTSNAAQLQSIYNYQQTVLEAHIEVVNHLSKVENYRRSIEVKRKQLQALEESVEAANKLFQNARAEYVEVLLAQRELQEARMELIEIKQEQLTAIVNAYQALGGGGF